MHGVTKNKEITYVSYDVLLGSRFAFQNVYFQQEGIYRPINFDINPLKTHIILCLFR
jgi:hypothetical protein